MYAKPKGKPPLRDRQQKVAASRGKNVPPLSRGSFGRSQLCGQASVRYRTLLRQQSRTLPTRPELWLPSFGGCCPWRKHGSTDVNPELARAALDQRSGRGSTGIVCGSARFFSEHNHSVSPVAFGLVKRDVGRLDDGIRIRRMVGENGYPQRQRDVAYDRISMRSAQKPDIRANVGYPACRPARTAADRCTRAGRR